VKKYARGSHAWGECERSGKKMLLSRMVEDGYDIGLMVDPVFYDPPHPQDVPATAGEAVALERPAPPRNAFSPVVSLPLYDVVNDQNNSAFPLGTSLGMVSFS